MSRLAFIHREDLYCFNVWIGILFNRISVHVRTCPLGKRVIWCFSEKIPTLTKILEPQTKSTRMSSSVKRNNYYFVFPSFLTHSEQAIGKVWNMIIIIDLIPSIVLQSSWLKAECILQSLYLYWFECLMPINNFSFNFVII